MAKWRVVVSMDRQQRMVRRIGGEPSPFWAAFEGGAAWIECGEVEAGHVGADDALADLITGTKIPFHIPGDAS